MSIQLYIYLLAAYLLFSWKSRQATGSEANTKTWVEAMLDCYNKNSFLESNSHVLGNYTNNHNEVKSVWVGSFKAVLAWIEIRGCYNIPLNSADRDEKVAMNPSVCQVKCMKRRYFAFNQHHERCVCFDEHGIVEKKSENASICQECTHQKGCTTYAVAYKVIVRRSETAGKEPICLAYNCSFDSQSPNFFESHCDKAFKSYCRNGQIAKLNSDLTFYEYLDSCAENQFSYPLLLYENPIKLCNVSKTIAVSIWVGVYRQILYVDHLGKTALNSGDFYMLRDYISHCSYLSHGGGLHMTKNCNESSTRHHYLCTTENSTNRPNDHTNTPTPSSGCCSKGVIAGTVISILVIVVVVVIFVIILGRRFNCKKTLFKTSKIKKNETTQENNSDGQYHEIDITLGPYELAKPISDNNTHLEKTAQDDNAYSRIVSAVFIASTVDGKTNQCIANPGYNDVQMINDKTNSNDYKDSSKSLPNATTSGDYSLAKPVSYLGEMDPYADNADYDHLSNVENRDDNTVKVYDHVPNIIDSDATYDHSTITTCKSESDNYDHFDVQN